MAENPIRDFTKDPINVALYGDAVDASILIEWQGRNRPTYSIFYDRRYEYEECDEPIYDSYRQTQSNPDAVFNQWFSGSCHVIAYYYPVDLESAPPNVHSNDFRVATLLYTQDIFVDPGGDNSGDGEACRAAPAACMPLAELEMVAMPLAELEIDSMPVADITQDAIPEAFLECRIKT